MVGSDPQYKSLRVELELRTYMMKRAYLTDGHPSSPSVLVGTEQSWSKLSLVESRTMVETETSTACPQLISDAKIRWLRSRT
jgi:hypothetical protein